MIFSSSGLWSRCECGRVGSWPDSLLFQVLSEGSERAKDAELDGGDGDAEGCGDLLVGQLLNESERGCNAEFGRKPREGLSGAGADLRGDGRVSGWC